jgi:segregation and condensation protein B
METVTELPSELTRQPKDEAVGDSPSDETDARLASIIESVLFASGSPMTVKQLAEILKGPRGSGPRPKDIEKALAGLLEEYAPGKRGIQLLEVSGGYQFRTARENAQWVRAVFRDKPARLGRATLETLAIVAYKQPATRADIEAVRGVDAEAAISTLLERRLVRIVGRKETVGRPLLYSTTPEFLEAFGLNDLKDLPSLKELGPVPDAKEHEPDPATASEEAALGSEAIAPEGDRTADVATITEAAEPGGHQLAPQGGGDDPRRPGAPERTGRDRAGDEGESEDRQDHS